MAASGVCHSCLHAADGSWKGVPLPIVLGDEGAGVVEALGPGVTELEVGDHVILSWAPTCGRCHYCVIGRPNLCERRQPGKGVLPDGTTRMTSWRCTGLPLRPRGHLRLAHGRARVVRDPHRSRDAARPRRPHRLLGHDRRGRGDQHRRGARRARAWPSSAWAASASTSSRAARWWPRIPIIAVDLLASKLDHARAVGATHAIDASKEDPVAAIRAITGRGADFTFVAVGATRPITQAIDALAPGGTCVLIGVPETGATVPLDVRPAGHGRAGHPRLELRQRAHARRPAAAREPLPGRQAAHRRADHPSLRARGRQRGVPRARRRRARPRRDRVLGRARARLRARVPRPRRAGPRVRPRSARPAPPRPARRGARSWGPTA